MKLSTKIYAFIFTTITLTLSLLTVLLHFKYHMTRYDLFDARLGILANDMKSVIERGFTLGLDLSKLHNVNKIIETGLKHDKDINRIVVFKYERNLLSTLYQTSVELETPLLNKTIIENMNSGATDYWDFKIGDTAFVGVTFKDTIGNIVGGLYLSYSTSLIEKAEKAEVYSLYLRLLLSVLFISLISYYISHKTINPLDKTLLEMNNVIAEYLKNPNNRKNFDLSIITEPELRKIFSQTLSSSKKTLGAFENLQKLINEVEKN